MSDGVEGDVRAPRKRPLGTIFLGEDVLSLFLGVPEGLTANAQNAGAWREPRACARGPAFKPQEIASMDKCPVRAGVEEEINDQLLTQAGESHGCTDARAPNRVAKSMDCGHSGRLACEQRRLGIEVLEVEPVPIRARFGYVLLEEALEVVAVSSVHDDAIPVQRDLLAGVVLE